MPTAPERSRPPALPRLLAVLATLSLLGLPLAARAQTIGDIAAGRHLSDMWCSSCHEIGPVPQRGADTGVPSFAAIAAMPSTTPMALRAFLQTPHADMPDLHLGRNEIDDVSAYILTLRHR